MAGSSSSSSAASSTINQQQQISKDETQIYDRQIRLWGLEAQNRLRNSSVLLVGLSGLGAEVAKNLMLSGLKSLTLMDEKEFSESDKGSQFLIPPGAKGNRAWASLERVKVLNPLVQVEVNTGAVRDQSEDFFRQFDLAICIDQDFEATNLVNKICRRHKIRFQAGGIFGWAGFAFFDFNQHAFLFPKPKQNQSIVEGLDDEDENGADQPGSSKKAKMGSNCGPSAPPVQTLTLDEEEEDAKIKLNVAFPSFEQTFDVQLGAKKLMRRRFNLPSTYFVVRAFLRLMKAKGRTFTKEEAIDQWKKELEAAALDESRQKVNADDFGFFIQRPLNPVCAIVGSVLSQEAIKALSQNDAPLKNMFLYSALDSVGAVCEISA